MEIGDLVECKHGAEWQNNHQHSDRVKARKLGRKQDTFVGNAAAYMHRDEAYVVEAITETGGLKFRGFASPVSPSDVQTSTKPVYR